MLTEGKIGLAGSDKTCPPAKFEFLLKSLDISSAEFCTIFAIITNIIRHQAFLKRKTECLRVMSILISDQVVKSEKLIIWNRNICKMEN